MMIQLCNYYYFFNYSRRCYEGIVCHEEVDYSEEHSSAEGKIYFVFWVILFRRIRSSL